MTIRSIFSIASLTLLALLVGCQPQSPDSDAGSDQAEQTPSDIANALFEDIFNESVMRSPMTQTYLSIKTDYDKLDSYTDETAEEELEIAKQNLARVQAIDPSALDNQTRLSLKLMTSS